MLKWRILTALCLIPLVIFGILRLGHLSFAVLSGAILLIGAHEWTTLCPYPKGIQQISFMALFAAICCCLYFMQTPLILMASLLFWLSAGILVYRFDGNLPKGLTPPFVKALLGLIVLSGAFYGLLRLHSTSEGAKWLIICLVLIWATDTFAYFTGRLIGKRPLAPLVSPKKTREGFWGGLIGTLLLAGGCYFAQLLPAISFSIWMGLALGTILLSVIGDLFESLMKRVAGVKDSGKLLPGHGGILDRLDSLFAAIPLFALVIVLLEKSL